MASPFTFLALLLLLLFFFFFFQVCVNTFSRKKFAPARRRLRASEGASKWIIESSKRTTFKNSDAQNSLPVSRGKTRKFSILTIIVLYRNSNLNNSNNNNDHNSNSINKSAIINYDNIAIIIKAYELNVEQAKNA